LGLIILGLNYLGIKAGKIYKDGAALVCETKRDLVRSNAIHYEKNKINVLFVGTSRILAGIKPTLFDNLTGDETYSYNLALPALPISSSYFILKEYLAFNPPPQYIVMQLHINDCSVCSLVNYYSSQGLDQLEEVLSLFLNSPGKGIILNYFFPFRMYKFFAVQYVYNLIFHPKKIEHLIKHNRYILNRMIEERGYYFIEEQAIPFEERLSNGIGGKKGGSPPDKQSQFNPFIDPFVEKFFNLTQKKGIKVLLIQPVYRINQCLQFEKSPLQFQLVLDRYSHVFIAKDGWKLKFYKMKYFSDMTHLNRAGADRFTREIQQEFYDVFIKNFQRHKAEDN